MMLEWPSLHSSRSKVTEGCFHHLNDSIQIQWPSSHTEPCLEKPDFNNSKTKGNKTKLKTPEWKPHTFFQRAGITDEPWIGS